ncbi:MAG: RNA polymerase sigma factor [Planctomycetes bacterium]|nr:RNA polymerase sigma factor [Planctomycetota bacterium]
MSGGAPRRVDEAELALWIERFRGPLIGLLASWCGNWRDAEELAADAFAEAWLSSARFDGDPRDIERSGAWLRGIAFRLHAVWQRKRALRRAEPLETARPVAPACETDERRDVLEAAFRRLAAPQQAILRMFYLEATSAREVAALLDITVKAAEERVRAARGELRGLVERELARREHGVRP